MKKQLIEFYLDWFDNYGSVQTMAEHYGLTEDECRQLIEIGRKYQFEEADLRKQIDARHAVRNPDKPLTEIDL